MEIRGLGYVGISATNVEGWKSMAEQALGMMATRPDDAGSVHLKMDERPYRFVIHPRPVDGLAYVGWEVASATKLGQATEVLQRAGVAVREATQEEAAERQVTGLVRLNDPAGNAVELFHGPVLDHRPFVSPLGVSGFITGALGLGHVVLCTPNYPEVLRFYADVLGFRVSDTMVKDGIERTFLRCNARHHSLGLRVGETDGLVHLMVEVNTLDDVGYGFDRCRAGAAPVASTIGKHTNDHMVSFYLVSPSAFEIEYGCNGRLVDEATWTTTSLTRPSLWGHHRS